MRKKIVLTVAALLSATSVISLAACGQNRGKEYGNKEKGERTEIVFLNAPNDTSNSAWVELVTDYNDGQGIEDNVFVTYKNTGSLTPADSVFKRTQDKAYNVVAISDNQNSLQKLAIESNAKYAPDGYFVDLTPYAEKDEDFKNSTIPDSVLNWWRVTRDPEAKQGSGQKKHIVGAGQKLIGVPYGTNAEFNWYNTAIFKAQGINIVSVPEEEMDDYNTKNSASLKPHGYAEYKEAPVSGMTKSKNLAGQEVYKVFNDCIGMNWEEQRNVLKYFTPEYNPKATTNYGFVSEKWFNYGWSVGGDVMGFNGEDYDFTLFDKRPNYMVTQDNTKIGNSTYNAGDIVRYEDRVNGIEKAATKPSNIYAIESQYNAAKEYVSLQVNSGTVVDESDGKTYYGYGVANPETGSGDNWFNTAQIAMVLGVPDGIKARMENTRAADFDICMPQTYREYEGGSVYYSGGTGYKNEHLKVIGETYEGKVYTGDIKVVNGTKIIGSTTSASISQGLVVSACSDPATYQASWDFISWVATEGQKYIAKTRTVAPVAEKTLFSDDYIGNEKITYGKNFYAVAKTSLSAGRGDWGYFENGAWVTNWSNDFNNSLRKGGMTITRFLELHEEASRNDLNNMYCVIKGIR